MNLFILRNQIEFVIIKLIEIQIREEFEYERLPKKIKKHIMDSTKNSMLKNFNIKWKRKLIFKRLNKRVNNEKNGKRILKIFDDEK